jgi:hypothetical protein
LARRAGGLARRGLDAYDACDDRPKAREETAPGLCPGEGSREGIKTVLVHQAGLSGYVQM